MDDDVREDYLRMRDAVDGKSPVQVAFEAMAKAAMSMERQLRRLQLMVALNMGLLIGVCAWLVLTHR